MANSLDLLSKCTNQEHLPAFTSGNSPKLSTRKEVLYGIVTGVDGNRGTTEEPCSEIKHIYPWHPPTSRCCLLIALALGTLTVRALPMDLFRRPLVIVVPAISVEM